jgi:hypothetical protein
MRRAFLWLCWAPAAVWLATLWSIRSYEGWGAWAAAPLLIPSLAMSVLWGAAGLAMVVATLVRSRRLDAPVLWAALAGSVVVLYYVGFNLFREY